MKKPLFFAALALGALLSCKKNSSGNNSAHITATVDGKNKTFNFSAVASRVTAYNSTYYSISGFAGNSPTTETMQLSIIALTNGVALKPGTIVDTSTQYAITGIYSATLTEPYEAGSQVYGNTIGSGEPPITNHFKVTVTALDSTSIRGTFSGDFYQYGSTDSTKKTVTNGDFFVKVY